MQGEMPESTRTRVQLNLRLLPLLVVLLSVVELLWSQRVWMMLLVGMGGIWLIDFVWARALARGLHVQRALRYGWTQVGDELEEQFTLQNFSRLPALWVEILDHSTLPDYQASVATGVEGASENVWRLRHICARRGVFTIGPTTVRSVTPFAVYTIEKEYSAHDALMVLPSVVPLPDIQVAPGGRAYEGRRRASTFERTVSASGVREYLPGDPFKALYWRAIAHCDALMVRTFDSTPAGDWWIWLDLDRAAQAGTGENSTIEHGVILAASLAERGLRAGHAVGLVANARELTWLAPQSGEGQRLQILRTLALVEPGPRSLAELLGSTRQSVSRGASLVVITPAVEGAWMEAVLGLAAQGTLPTVLLLDRATYGGMGHARAATALLEEWGVPHYLIPRDLLDRPESRPGREGHWEWHVGATGRAIAREAPRDRGWRTLA